MSNSGKAKKFVPTAVRMVEPFNQRIKGLKQYIAIATGAKIVMELVIGDRKDAQHREMMTLQLGIVGQRVRNEQLQRRRDQLH